MKFLRQGSTICELTGKTITIRRHHSIESESLIEITNTGGLQSFWVKKNVVEVTKQFWEFILSDLKALQFPE